MSTASATTMPQINDLIGWTGKIIVRQVRHVFWCNFQTWCFLLWAEFQIPVDPRTTFSLKKAGRERNLSLPGATLGISGWGCATWTVEPLAWTRASSAEFYYPIKESTFFNDKNKRKELNTMFRWLHVIESSKLCVQFLSLVCIIRCLY